MNKETRMLGNFPPIIIKGIILLSFFFKLWCVCVNYSLSNSLSINNNNNKKPLQKTLHSFTQIYHSLLNIWTVLISRHGLNFRDTLCVDPSTHSQHPPKASVRVPKRTSPVNEQRNWTVKVLMQQNDDEEEAENGDCICNQDATWLAQHLQ